MSNNLKEILEDLIDSADYATEGTSYEYHKAIYRITERLMTSYEIYEELYKLTDGGRDAVNLGDMARCIANAQRVKMGLEIVSDNATGTIYPRRGDA